MILLGIGANLPAPGFAGPREGCEAALGALGAEGIRVVARSHWYRTAPVPPSDQPWFINAVVMLEVGKRTPTQLMAVFHRLEKTFGRTRGEKNAARVLDLDLLDFDGKVTVPPESPILPHPRMHQRAFVLLPLAEIAPDWCHPATGVAIEALVASLPADQIVTRLVDD